ncbi:hypothetical protein LX36DRAFT_664656 [Colletotrichum falcatum]|nr:hypothetical protein LX36DRAFT_664656 [Colletotrichum falcatum]
MGFSFFLFLSGKFFILVFGMGRCPFFVNPKLDDKTYNGENPAKAWSPAEPKPQSGIWIKCNGAVKRGRLAWNSSAGRERVVDT